MGISAPSSLVLATDLDVLAADRVVHRADGYWVVRSPRNPGFYWGNLLVFDDAPAPGDCARWPTLFDREFAGSPDVVHRTFIWDRVDGAEGAAVEFVAAGYAIERTVGLIARPEEIVPHARADRSAQAVRVRALDPADDELLWEQVAEAWVADNTDHDPNHFRRFAVSRLAELREIFSAGRGAWFVALDGEVVAGSLGIVVTGPRARYQQVGTAAAYRRRGIASRLVVDAARMTVAAAPDVTHFVIAADPEYHALGIYESLGFRRVERVCGVCIWPGRV